MIVRCAYLEGDVLPENRARFDAFIAAEVVPLMKRFPGVQSVRVMRAAAVEDGGHSLYMSFESAYPSQEALDFALSQPIRLELRAKMKEILPLFQGRMFHITQAMIADAKTA